MTGRLETDAAMAPCPCDALETQRQRVLRELTALDRMAHAMRLAGCMARHVDEARRALYRMKKELVVRPLVIDAVFSKGNPERQVTDARAKQER